MPDVKTGFPEREILRGVLYLTMIVSFLLWWVSLQITHVAFELSAVTFFSFLISLAALALSARPRG